MCISVWYASYCCCSELGALENDEQPNTLPKITNQINQDAKNLINLTLKVNRTFNVNGYNQKVPKETRLEANQNPEQESVLRGSNVQKSTIYIHGRSQQNKLYWWFKQSFHRNTRANYKDQD